MRKAFVFIFPFILLTFLLSEEKVRYLKKVGEIKDGFSSEKENFFIKGKLWKRWQILEDIRPFTPIISNF